MSRKKPASPTSTPSGMPIDVAAFNTLIDAIEDIYDIAFIPSHCETCLNNKLEELQESSFPPAGALLLEDENLAAALEGKTRLRLHVHPGIVGDLSKSLLKDLEADPEIERQLIADALDREAQREQMLDEEEICGVVGSAFQGFGFEVHLTTDKEKRYTLELHIDVDDWKENWKNVSSESSGEYEVGDLIERLGAGGESIPPELIQRLYELHAEGKLPAEISAAVEKLGNTVEVS